MVMVSNHINCNHVMDGKNKKGVLAEICLDKINPQKKEAAEGVKLKLLHNIYII